MISKIKLRFTWFMLHMLLLFSKDLNKVQLDSVVSVLTKIRYD